MLRPSEPHTETPRRDDLDVPETVAIALLLRHPQRKPLSYAELANAADGHILRTMPTDAGLIVEVAGRMAM